MPFIGRAGQLLTKIIEAIGLERQDVYIANVIKCRPPGNRNPEPDEVEQCEPYLFRQIDVIQPKVIVPLGKFAADALTPGRKPGERPTGGPSASPSPGAPAPTASPPRARCTTRSPTRTAGRTAARAAARGPGARPCRPPGPCRRREKSARRRSGPSSVVIARLYRRRAPAQTR